MPPESPEPPESQSSDSPPPEHQESSDHHADFAPDAQSEPLMENVTWQPPQGRTYRIIAWIIILGFLFCVAGFVLLMLYNEFGLHRIS